MLALGAVSATGQNWINPGTTSSPSSCAPFKDQFAGPTSLSYYCYYNGTFPWLAAGGGWTTGLRIAAPASGAIEVKYNFYQQDASGAVDPIQLDYQQFGNTGVDQSSDATFDLNKNQPSELTLLGKTIDGAAHLTTVTGTVRVEVRCPDKATCAATMPQLIYSALPGTPWYLSAAMSSNVSLPIQPDSTLWSVVGINDPNSSSLISFVILNDSGIDDQTYVVKVYDKAGAFVGSTPVHVASGRNVGRVLDDKFLPTVPKLPVGPIKLVVEGTGTCLLTVLQFKGAAATALVPVAEQFPISF
jgi:hypothetical protein